jgi:hypothetical protein
MRSFFAAFLLMLMLLSPSLWAIDVNPNRRTIPDKFINPPGKRYSLFAGDPARVQRANEINLKEFKTELAVAPASISLSQPVSEEGGTVAGFKVTFKVQNIGKKKSYPLSFPDAQRFDIAVTGAGDALIWLWSDDKVFVQETDSLIVNPGEAITYTETIPVEALAAKSGPGTYKITVILSNYPELKEVREIVIQP